MPVEGEDIVLTNFNAFERNVMATHLVWFRADLRIHDNLALAVACRDPHAEVLGMFIATPGQWRQHGWRRARRRLWSATFTACKWRWQKRGSRCRLNKRRTSRQRNAGTSQRLMSGGK
jgi:deoxyribodipyrimidine photolyase